MYKINRWTFRYQWGGVQLGAEWVARVGKALAACITPQPRLGRHHASRYGSHQGQPVYVGEILARECQARQQMIDA